MTFTGGWLRAQGPFYKDPDALVHTADPAHDDTEAPDSNSWTYMAPPGMAQSGEIPTDEWMGVYLPAYDNTPQDHESGIGVSARYSDPYIGVTGLGGGNLSAQQEAAAESAKDYGYPGVDARTNERAFQFYNERYGGDRFDSFGPQPIDDAALRRGGNSDPINNPPIEGQPEGFRLGSDLVPWLDRKFRIGQRFHDRHVITPNDQQEPTNQIPPAGSKSTYLSPFPSAQRQKTRTWNTPARPQSPPDFSESLVTDVDVSADVFPDWSMT